MDFNETNDILDKNDTEKLEAIRKFLLDIDCLDKLKEWQYGVNFFEVSGMINKEVKHSKVLSWILDANGSHGLNDKVIKKFLQQIIIKGGNAIGEGNINDIIDISLMDFSTFTVKTEYKNIDILLISEKANTAIIIENKVYAGERTDGDDGGQLKKYLDIIQNEYPNYRKMAIFLTREGEEPSDTDNWYIANYSILVEIISEIIDNSPEIQTNTKVILEHYINMIRRHLIVDTRLQEICREIYNKHRDALDLIFDNRPDNKSEISDFISECLNEVASKEKIFIKDTNSTKKYIRFSTEYIEKLLPPLTDATFGGWGIGYRFLYEFNCSENGVVFAAFVFPQDEICKKIFEYGQQNFSKYGIKKTNKIPSKCATTVWRCSILNKDDVIGFDDESNKRDIQKKLKKEIMDLFPKISAFEKDMGGKLNN